jgi:hypothetical protein
MALFASGTAANNGSHNGECLANVNSGGVGHGTCEAAIPADTLASDFNWLLGPTTASTSVSNLVVTSDATPTGTQSELIEIVDNTTGTTLISCTVNSSSSPAGSCNSTNSASVPIGHYLQVVQTKQNGAGPETFRVSFRY